MSMLVKQSRLRTCVGCGKISVQSEMVRFVRKDGMIVEDNGKTTGRGAYLCMLSRELCSNKASQRRSFERALPEI